jgi:hypothetical protein
MRLPMTVARLRMSAFMLGLSFQVHCRIGRRLGAASARDEIVDDENHCDDQQEVDESAADVNGKTQEPQNEKYDDDCPEHELIRFLFLR